MRRVLQLHLCVIYFFSGLVKCLGTGWWTGANVWRALTHPPFNILDPRFLTEWRYLFPLLGALVCLMETSYPLLIWPTRTRAVWLGLIISMHIVIALLMGMYLFALVMIVLNIAAFGTGEWLTVEREHRGAPGVD